MKFSAKIFSFLPLFFCFFILSCEKNEDFLSKDKDTVEVEKPRINPEKVFTQKSTIDPLITFDSEFSNVEAYSLISTGDTIGENFQLKAYSDGAGFLRDNENYIYVVNLESKFSIARIFLDKNLTPSRGDYLLNSTVSNYAKQCSATMWEASVHGGNKDIFLSASEAFHYQVKALDPRIEIPDPTADYSLKALGEFSWENAVPLPKSTYPGRTVIIGGDDDATDSAGQVILYYSENGDADLENGKVYVLRTKQISNGNGIVDVNPNMIHSEADFDFGKTYEVEFVEIENARDLTKDEMEIACINSFATQFMRVEDLDYQKGDSFNARNIFFAATGLGPGAGSYNDWGTVYRLELDEESPLTGKLTQVISGNTDTNDRDGNLPILQSPDNICVTENFVYVQEDPNSFARDHAPYIYQSDLNGRNIKKVLELNPLDNGQFKGEFGSLIDISEKVNFPGTFILALMPQRQIMSQILLLKGLPQ